MTNEEAIPVLERWLHALNNAPSPAGDTDSESALILSIAALRALCVLELPAPAPENEQTDQARCDLPSEATADPRGDDRDVAKGDWEPSGKCQYVKCDGAKFDYDSTESRWGSWFCVKCGGMQIPPRVVGVYALIAEVRRDTIEAASDLLRLAEKSNKDWRWAFNQLALQRAGTVQPQEHAKATSVGAATQNTPPLVS